jgi:hypothetical protein
MPQIASAFEGGQLLRALGIETKRIRKAVISIEVGKAITCEITAFCELDPQSKDIGLFVQQYQLVRKEDDGPSSTP